MIKTYKKYFYPNPLRYRKLKNTINQDETFKEVQQKLEPFLANKFSLIQEYIDEFGDIRSEIKLIRILREKIRENYHMLKNKTNFFSKGILEQFDQINNLENYQKSLRYLDLPVQPITDKKGFEIQFLSNELIEDTIEEIEDGFSFIYDYYSNFFPESTELWTEYALLEPNEFPYISHDEILESTYEIFDKIFYDLQKNSVNLYNWVISGDLNSRVLKIVKPRFQATRIQYLLPILTSLISLTIFLWIIKYLISKLKPILIFKSKKLTVENIKNTLGRIQTDLNFTKFRIQQKTNKLKIRALNIKTNCKYKILKTIVGKT